MIFRCGTMFCLGGTLTAEQKIYTRGDGDFGPAFSVVNTPVLPALGGDDVYWAQFVESAAGESHLTLAPRWPQNTSGWTIFGGMVRFGNRWPCNLFDCLMFELVGGGVRQAGIYGEFSSGNIYLIDSAGNQAISLADPVGLDGNLLYVAAVQLTNPGDSKLWIYTFDGLVLQASGTGTGNNFQTGTPLTMTYKLQGQNHGGAPVGSPTTTYIMNPFVFDGSTDPVADHPRRVAGLFYTCIDGDATPPFEFDGTQTSPETGSAGVWSDTDDESAGSNLTYPTFGNGGMNIVDGPLGDARLDPSTTIWGSGVCFHTDSVTGATGATEVSAGRDDGSASVQDRAAISGSAYGAGGDNHGGVIVVDNIAYDENLVGGHRSRGFGGGKFSELNAMRGWVLVDPSTFASTGIAVLRRRIEGHA